MSQPLSPRGSPRDRAVLRLAALVYVGAWTVWPPRRTLGAQPDGFRRQGASVLRRPPLSHPDPGVARPRRCGHRLRGLRDHAGAMPGDRETEPRRIVVRGSRSGGRRRFARSGRAGDRIESSRGGERKRRHDRLALPRSQHRRYRQARLAWHRSRSRHARRRRGGDARSLDSAARIRPASDPDRRRPRIRRRLQRFERRARPLLGPAAALGRRCWHRCCAITRANRKGALATEHLATSRLTSLATPPLTATPADLGASLARRGGEFQGEPWSRSAAGLSRDQASGANEDRTGDLEPSWV